jgi:hypothetical protein
MRSKESYNFQTKLWKIYILVLLRNEYEYGEDK